MKIRQTVLSLILGHIWAEVTTVYSPLDLILMMGETKSTHYRQASGAGLYEGGCKEPCLYACSDTAHCLRETRQRQRHYWRARAAYSSLATLL